MTDGRRNFRLPGRPMWGRLGDVLLGVTTVAVVVAVTAAVRPAAGPADRPGAVTAAARRAAITSNGTTVLRWVGSACPADEAGTFTRSTDGGRTWAEIAVPLVTVEALSLSGAVGLALGRDDRCQPASAWTADGGTTWRAVALPTGTSSIDVVGGGGVWSVVAGEVRRGAVAGARAVTNGCLVHADAPRAAIVQAFGPVAGWLVCQQGDGVGRLLLSTSDGGRTWQVASQFDDGGNGPVDAMDFTSFEDGWALIRGGDCPAGELRTTTDGGTTWDDLPCVTTSLPGASALLAVTFANAETAYAAAVVTGEVVFVRSDDGGITWAPVD